MKRGNSEIKVRLARTFGKLISLGILFKDYFKFQLSGFKTKYFVWTFHSEKYIIQDE